jgi:serine protease Do
LHMAGAKHRNRRGAHGFIRQVGALICSAIMLAMALVGWGTLFRHDPAAWLPDGFPLNGPLRQAAGAIGWPTPEPSPATQQLSAWHGRASTITFGFFTVHTGTGFGVDATHLVTAAHVVTGRTDVTIAGKGGAAVQTVDQQYDLALLTVQGSSLLASRPAFHLDTNRRWAGEHVWVICEYGDQQIVPMDVSNPSVQVDEQAGDGSVLFSVPDALLLSGSAHPGCSGGPVVDGSGNVVGLVVTAGLSGTAAVSAADIAPWLTSQGISLP